MDSSFPRTLCNIASKKCGRRCAACLRFVHLSGTRLSRYASSSLLFWECSTCTGVWNCNRPMPTDNSVSPDAVTTVEVIFQALRVRIPKSVRSTVAEALASIIDDALFSGDNISRSKLLSFAAVVFGVSSRITIRQHLWHPLYAIIH